MNRVLSFLFSVVVAASTVAVLAQEKKGEDSKPKSSPSQSLPPRSQPSRSPSNPVSTPTTPRPAPTSQGRSAPTLPPSSAPKSQGRTGRNESPGSLGNYRQGSGGSVIPPQSPSKGGGGGKSAPPQSPPRGDGGKPPQGSLPPIDRDGGKTSPPTQPSQGPGRGSPPLLDGGGKTPPRQGGLPETKPSTNPRPVGPPILTGPGAQITPGKPPPQPTGGPLFQPRSGGSDPSKTSNAKPMPAVQIGPGSGTNGYQGWIQEIPIGLNPAKSRWCVEDFNRHRWLRYGYCSYYPTWYDWWFGYRWYYFNPVPYQCVFSPYYVYWCVPGYVSYVRCFFGRTSVIIVYGDPLSWAYCGRGTSVNFYSNYSGYDYGSRHYSAFDRALSNLVDAFKYGDERMLDRLVSRGGQVDIFIEGEYAYAISSDDYYDMTADLIKTIATVDFDIVQVKRSKDGGYVAVARHTYRDTFSIVQTNWLTFTLREDRGQFYITQAGTSKDRPYL